MWWKDEITLEYFLQISQVIFFFLHAMWICGKVLLLLKANICVCLKLLFNEKSYTSLIACVMFLQLKTAVGNDYWFVAQFLLAFLLHHIYILHNLCVYSFLGHYRTSPSVLSLNPRAKFIRILNKQLRVSSRFTFQGMSVENINIKYNGQVLRWSKSP